MNYNTIIRHFQGKNLLCTCKILLYGGDMEQVTRVTEFLDGTSFYYERADVRRNYLLYGVSQCGVAICGLNHMIRRSGANSVGIHYQTVGEYSLETDGKSWHVSPGQLWFFDEIAESTLRPVGKIPSKGYFIHIYGFGVHEFISALVERYGHTLDGYDATDFCEKVMELSWALRRNTADPIETSRTIYGIMLDIMKFAGVTGFAPVRDSNIERAKSFIDTNFARPITLDDIAEAANYSKFYFFRKFRNCLGITPKEYLDRVRFQESKLLLRDRRLTLSEIAYRIGLSDVRSLKRLYLEQSMLTPDEYRKYAIDIDDK